MQKRYGKLKLRRSIGTSSFKGIWKKIIEVSTYDENDENYKSFMKDLYFESIPYKQELLTQNEMISTELIDYSNFTGIINNQQINNYSLYECFHGILMYIYYYSTNKFNTNEIEVHFSGSRNIIWDNNKRFNIMNIFDYENINTKIDIENTIDAFFGITFKRIKIQPQAYSIRSSVLSSLITQLVSFTFEGYDEENQRWDVLDERDNINDLIKSGGFCLFYVQTTTKCYSSFKIRQTGPGSNKLYGFSIAAFDIHGVAYYRDDLNNFDSNTIYDKCIYNNDLTALDPCEDLSNLII